MYSPALQQLLLCSANLKIFLLCPQKRKQWSTDHVTPLKMSMPVGCLDRLQNLVEGMLLLGKLLLQGTVCLSAFRT
jgi:hypothetical protein